MERVKVVRAIVHVPLKPGSRRSGNSEGAGAFLLHQPAIRRHDKRRPQCGVSVHSIISQPRDCDLVAAPDPKRHPYVIVEYLDSDITLSVPRLLEVVAMNNKLDQDSSQVSDQLHPFIYAALAGLALCLVVSAWILFFNGGYLELDLGIISALVFMIIAIPTVLHFVSRRFQAPDRASGIGRPLDVDCRLL